MPQEYIDEYGIEFILQSSGVLDAIAGDILKLPNFVVKDPAFNENLLRTIEQPGIIGDMLSSACKCLFIPCCSKS